MKFRNLILAAAAFFTMAACDKTEELGPKEVTASASELAFDIAGGTQTITLKATVDWAVKGYTDEVKEWLVIDPDNGKASNDELTISIKANANDGKDRSATIEFYGDVLHKSPLQITQAGKSTPKGDGTAANPYSASQARDIALNGTPSEDYVYIHGFIKKIATQESAIAQYGNHNFYICDTAEADDEDFYCFQVYDLGKVKFTDFNKIKVGDEVVVCGHITNYNGIPETVGKGDGYLYSLNGETSSTTPPSEDVDYNNCEALSVQAFIAKADQNTYYKLSGTVSSFNATYCSFNLTDDSGMIYVYSVDNKADWSSKISDGGTVTLAGKYLYYESKSQHEVVNAQILSFTEAEDVPAEKVSAEGLVVALSQNSFLVKTADSYAYAYNKDAAPTVKIGDMVKVEGEKSMYGELPEIVNYTVSVLSSDNTVEHPSATALDATALDAYGTIFGYVSFTGNLSISGNYHNITVPGATRVGSLASTTGDYSAMSGKNVDVKGYYIGISGGKYFNVMETELTLSEDQTTPDPGTGGGDSGDEGTGYTITWGESTNSGKISSYTSTWTVTADGLTCTMANWNNNNNGWNYVKAGRKNNASVATITTSTAIPEAVKAVKLTIDAVTADKINSLKLYTSTNSDFSSKTEYSFTVATGVQSITLPSPTANLYYQIEVDAVGGSSNGLITVSKLVFVTN